MNRIAHILLLLTILPAFLMPARVNLCLVNGLGSSCCMEYSDSCCAKEKVVQEEAKATCCSKCKTKAPKEQEDKDDSGAKIRSGCSCCVAIENTQDDLEKSETEVSVTSPRVSVTIVAQILASDHITLPVLDTRPQHDPPRLAPLQV